MTALLQAAEIVVRFGGLAAVNGVSLEVHEGQIVGLIGSNGAGKTTTFNVLSGLQRADAGRITFAGDDITDLPAHRRAALGMGRAFQNLGLAMDETVCTNLLAAQHLGAGYHPWDPLIRPGRWRRAERRLAGRAHAAAERFGVAQDLDRIVADLSFSGARFVELAAVLLEEPRLMLLDEPTTGLDVDEVHRLTQVLLDVREGGTSMLVVAHDVRFTLAICDHVYVLAEGRVICEGPPDVVRADPAVIESYLGTAAA